MRLLREPMRVGEHDLPAGARVAPLIYLTNRNPRVYERPAEFMPERFLERPPETFAWIPFGGGIRRCIGAALAQAEMAEVLRIVLERVELVPERSELEPVVLRGITLVPRHGVKVRVAAHAI
jgi:cytochrome P450